MNITYIIPDKEKHGGIQTLANSYYDNAVEQHGHHIEKVNYSYDVPLFFSMMVKLAPSFVKVFLAQQLVLPHFVRKNEHQKFGEIVHCWHLDAALFFPISQKLVVTVHGLEILDNSIENNWYRKQFYPRVMEQANQIICDSDYTRELLLSRYPSVAEKSTVLYPPIEFSKFQEKKKKKSSESYTIGMLCRFVKRKNVHNVIAALKELHRKLPNFTFLLAGDGPEKEHLISLLQEVDFSWKYLGKITEEQKITEFYPSLDVFVMPTLNMTDDIEGFGIVYLEANASGVPVVASRSGGAKEAVSDGVSGLFCDPTNPHDISTKLHDALVTVLFDQDKIRAWAKSFDVYVLGKKLNKIYGALK